MNNQIIFFENILEEMATKLDSYMTLHKNFLFNIPNIDKPISVFSTSSFLPRIESIRLGIFEAAKINEIYSMKILTRSLLEHFFKFQFLLFKTLDSKDDNIGIDYWFFGQIKENIDFEKSVNSLKEIYNIEDNQISILKTIYKNLSPQEIKHKQQQFEYKKIIHYLHNEIASNANDDLIYFAKNIPRFSLLSSYVHGGADAIKQENFFGNDVDFILYEATMISLMTRYYTYILFYQYDKKFDNLIFFAKNAIEKCEKSRQKASANTNTTK